MTVYIAALLFFLRFYIELTSDPTRRFSIDQSGQVRIQNMLDRETVAEHRINVLAIDNVNGK